MPFKNEHIFKVKVEEGEYTMYLPDADVDYIQKHIAEAAQPYELDMLRDMANRLKPGDIVLDVGANVGNHTLYLAALAKVEVHAFEPNTYLVDVIEKSVEVSLLKEKVKVHPVGLGSTKALGHFKEALNENLGGQSVEVGEGELHIQPLDSIEFLKPIAMIKIDVEGMELEVLKGAVGTIKTHLPTLYVEALTLEEFEGIEGVLSQLGYIVLETFNASPTHLFIHIDKLDRNTIEKYSAKNIVTSSYLLPQELRKTKEMLHQANLKYRNINEQVSELEKQLSKTDNIAESLLSKELVSKLTLLQSRAEKKEELLTNALSEIASLSDSGSDNYQVVKSLLDGREELVSKLADLQSRAEKKEGLLINALSEIASLSDSGSDNYQVVKSLLDGREELVSKLTDLQSSAEKKEEQLNEIALKQDTFAVNALRHLSNQSNLVEMVKEKDLSLNELAKKNKQLKDKVVLMEKERKESENNLLSRNDKVIQTLKDEISILQANLNKATQDKALSDLAKLKAFKQVDELRSSIMFQLGYALVNAGLSFRGFFSLPIRLFNIIKQGVKKALNPKFNVKQKSNSKLTKKRIAVKSKLLINPPLELENFKATKALLNTKKATLKVACIMDEFTFDSYEPTCNLIQLTPNNWLKEIDDFQPELLFIESAWRGKDELWGSKVGHNSTELQAIISWCKDKDIPTLFWNKEDPVHYQTFLTVAKQFDHVFTTDLDCVSRYKAALKHNNVYFLPFACQPLVHNPIEKFERKDAISFAGAYYKKYPERTKDLEGFVEILPEIKRFEIFDRNYGKDDPNYMFPEMYKPFIVGTLPFDKIDVAYKGYKYAINLNSIKQSQTMFARRLYELLASNTLTVSNFSKGIRLMFGDLVICSDSSDTVKKELLKNSEDNLYSDKLRLAGMRKTLSEHTYQHRFSYIEEKIFDNKAAKTKNIAVVAFVDNKQQTEDIISSFEKQNYQSKSLFIFVKGKGNQFEQYEADDIKVICFKSAAKSQLEEIFNGFTYMATFDPSDFYGENYLTDLALHFSYLNVDAVGKKDCFALISDNMQRLNKNLSYQLTDNLAPPASLVRLDVFASFNLKAWKKLCSGSFGNEYQQFSSDRFNYCKGGLSDVKKVEGIVSDIKGLNTGKSLNELLAIAEKAEPMRNNAAEHLLDNELLRTVFEKAKANHIKASFEDSNILLCSSLDDAKHEYLYGIKPISISEFNPVQDEAQAEQEIKLFVDATPGLTASFVLIYLDENQQRLFHNIITVNQNKSLKVPLACKYVKVGFRALSSGECEIKGIVLGERNLMPTSIVGSSNTLLITNHYPSNNDLYRNGFVHSRVKAYKESGSNVDVFRLWQESSLSYHEFDAIDVVTGNKELLKAMLASNHYKSILVHFIDEHMWEVLKEVPKSVQINIWVHGAEVQPWWRREYNYTTDEELAIGKAQSEVRQAFWKSMLTPFPKNFHFIFVSQYFADEVMEDLEINFPKEQYEIIHNPIDTELFNFIEKPVEQRKKILSIRPYASAKYANDLSVKAVQLLSKKPWFNELEFRFIGDGKLFEKVLSPIKDFENVIIERKFLKHSEIADMHKDYGVFLCPTRMDAQGVSKDEAMSSGLVVISNGVTAIPEFVDENCGILVDGESAEQMAEGIESVYLEPRKFEVLSKNAADRVRIQTAASIILNQELEALKTK